MMKNYSFSYKREEMNCTYSRHITQTWITMKKLQEKSSLTVSSWRTTKNVTLWDLGEVDENFSDDDAEGVTLSLQVTIFSESDEVELAREIKKLMKEKDFSFEGRNGDDSKPEDGIYMKAQRFSKFYEMEE